MKYKVKDVAELSGISVRTLHHYDHIGLLEPEEIGENGYRLYSEENLVKLQQIMFLRELDFTLKKIGEIVEDQRFRKAEALRKQRALLLEKRDRLNGIIETLEKTIASQEEGTEMDKDNMFKAFDMKEIEEHQKKYAAEVEKEYGKSEAYKESIGRTKNYNKEDWAVIKSESDEIMSKMAGLMDREPSDPAVLETVAQWQHHISDRYYNCTKEILAGLGETYVDDERFAGNIDKFGEGLSVFFRDAIRVYVSRSDT